MNINTPDIEKELIELTNQFIIDSGEGHRHRSVTMDVSLQRHLGIDSLGRAELFSRIEKKFDVQLSQQLLAEANTLKDILKAIAASPHHEHYIQNSIIHTEDKVSFNPASAKTLVDVLLLYAIQTPDRPHIYLQDEHGKEEIITYGKLLDTSLLVAHSLQHRGMRPGDTIAIMLPTTSEFFYTFYGVLLAGCIPVPIYPPLRPHLIESYAKQEAKILKNAEVRMLITFHEAEKLSKLLRAFIPSLKSVAKASILIDSKIKAPIYPLNSDDFGLIQYTSGSTSAPKGVLLTHQNLLSNIRAYGEAIGITSKDVTVSWAPLYHDLGLIGMWFGSLYHGIPLVLMSPLTFLTRPERWLWAMHYHRGTISGGPNFAYELCVRKIDPAQIEGLDLSSWRLAVNGAEAIQPKTLKNFTEKFAPYGFNADAHFPVYGLAESTVCVATSPLNRGPRIDIILRDALEKEGKAIIADQSEKNILEFVACGKPIPNHEMRVVDQQGDALPERRVGHVQFKGPSSMQGYYGNPEATQAIFQDGWCGTGDYAYIADGELFITGRRKDMIIKAGRNLYPAEIEELTGQVLDIRKGCVIAFGVNDPQRGTEKLIIIAETHEKNPQDREHIIEAINEKIVNALDILPDNIVLVAPRTIPKTSSGKLQRSACKAAYLNGTISNKGAPAWLQITKLSLKFAGIKFVNILKTIGNTLFTAYVLLTLGLTLPIVWMTLLIFPKKIAAPICHYWARFMTIITGCPLRVTGKENLYKQHPVIYAPNHASYVDALLMLALLPPDTRLVGKSEINTLPIVRTFVKKLGYIAVDRVDMSKGIEDTLEMKKLLEQGHSLMIFPEGTFSYAKGLRPFKLGAFKVAAETNTPICPIALEGSRYILRGEERMFKPNIVKVTACNLIFPSGSDWKSIMRLKNETREAILRYCGEPALDLIMAGIAEPRNKHTNEKSA